MLIAVSLQNQIIKNELLMQIRYYTAKCDAIINNSIHYVIIQWNEAIVLRILDATICVSMHSQDKMLTF
jgi:hypothetical protein